MDGIIFSIIIGFIIGTLFYYFDIKSGKKLYKRWYDVSNKDNLDASLGLGFVHGRLFGQKLKVAIILSVVGYALGFLVFGMSPFIGLFYGGGLAIGLLLSFYTSNKLLGVFSKRANKTIEYIESIEKGEKKVSEEINKIVKGKKKEEEEVIQEKEEVKPEEVQKQEPPKDDKKDDKDDDWRSGVKKFLDK